MATKLNVAVNANGIKHTAETATIKLSAGTMTDSATEIIEQVSQSRDRMLTEIHRVIYGQDDAIEQIMICLLAGGHSLLVGVPGLGKTLLVKTIAQLFDLDFRRIQFTPDLMPADIFGTQLFEEDPATGKRFFRFAKGPIFGNIVLADEINRTPPKTQAALLEAMQERHVTAAGETHPLDAPFFVLATQNPIEQEGTYPLPEAQLDRFLLNIVLDYLPIEAEERMVSATTAPAEPDLTPILDGAKIIELQRLVREVPADSSVVSFAVRLVNATRPDSELAPTVVRDKVKWGAGSRASQALILCGKARALLQGRCNVAEEDVRALAEPVLRHRIITNFHAEAEGLTPTDIIREVAGTVKM